MTDFDGAELALLREDLAYHQARVLLLVAGVSRTKGNNGKLDGLTKLAKLDFLLRYPALAPEVLDRRQGHRRDDRDTAQGADERRVQ